MQGSKDLPVPEMRAPVKAAVRSNQLGCRKFSDGHCMAVSPSHNKVKSCMGAVRMATCSLKAKVLQRAGRI